MTETDTAPTRSTPPSSLAATPGSMAATAGGIGMTVRTIAITVGPAVAALSWTLAAGGVSGFRAGVLVLTAAMLAGLLVLLAPPPRQRQLAQ